MSAETPLRPIETHWNGYRFRSRLEARLAVFLHALGVAFEYEPQGFSLPSGPYLPDFWVPEWRTWLEIKPDDGPSDDVFNNALRALSDLENATGHVALMLRGRPWPSEYRLIRNRELLRYERAMVWMPTLMAFGVCEYGSDCSGICLIDTLCPIRETGQPCPCCDRRNHFVLPLGRHPGHDCPVLYNPLPMGQRLMDAFRCARTARWEHGESPIVTSAPARPTVVVDPRSHEEVLIARPLRVGALDRKILRRLKDAVSHECSEIGQSLVGQRVTIAGVVMSVRRLMTKSRGDMATTQIEDASSRVEVVAFPRIWKETEALWTGTDILVVGGTVEWVDDHALVVADTVRRT